MVVRFDEEIFQLFHQANILFVELWRNAVLIGEMLFVLVQWYPRMVQVKEFLTNDRQQWMAMRTCDYQICQLVYGQCSTRTTLTSNNVRRFLEQNVLLIFLRTWFTWSSNGPMLFTFMTASIENFSPLSWSCRNSSGHSLVCISNTSCSTSKVSRANHNAFGVGAGNGPFGELIKNVKNDDCLLVFDSSEFCVMGEGFQNEHEMEAQFGEGCDLPRT